MILACGRTIVTTIGKPAPLAYRSRRVAWVNIFALAANTGRVAVGDRTVSEQPDQYSGCPLDAGDSVIWDHLDGVDLADIYVDAAVADEGVRWVAMTNG